MTVGNLIRLLRPEQWLKNLFVFLPIFFGGYLLDGSAWAASLVAFLSFCAAASSIYCLNDIRDIEADRIHPRKCRRPVASGAVSITAARMTFIILALIAMSVPFLLGPGIGLKVGCIVIGYLALNIAYCYGLKQVAILDVFIIASGFVLRLVSGGVAAGIWLSPWIVLMTFLLALFLAFAKRRDDVMMRERQGVVTRRNTDGYNLAYMNAVLGVLAAITLVCYIMYTVSPEVEERLGSEYVYVSVIFVLAAMLRYLQVSIVSEDSGSPTQVLLHDRFIQICVVCWFLFFGFIIYLQ